MEEHFSTIPVQALPERENSGNSLTWNLLQYSVILKLNYKTNRIPSCCIAMDDKTKQDGRDDSKVDLNDPNQVSYAAQ